MVLQLNRAGLCEELPNASAASDHVLVAVPVQGYVVEVVKRLPQWRRVGPEWKLEGGKVESGERHGDTSGGNVEELEKGP